MIQQSVRHLEASLLPRVKSMASGCLSVELWLVRPSMERLGFLGLTIAKGILEKSGTSI